MASTMPNGSPLSANGIDMSNNTEMKIGGIRILRCTSCNRHKEETEFYTDRRTKTGRHAWCKDCRKKIRYNRMKALWARLNARHAK